MLLSKIKSFHCCCSTLSLTLLPQLSCILCYYSCLLYEYNVIVFSLCELFSLCTYCNVLYRHHYLLPTQLCKFCSEFTSINKSELFRYVDFWVPNSSRQWYNNSLSSRYLFPQISGSYFTNNFALSQHENISYTLTA
jgi:hypothetical protein